jgi:hypothetical protein
MANGQAPKPVFFRSKRKYKRVRDLVSIIGLLFPPRGYCRFSAMSDMERPKPELYREAAERLRQLAREARLPDIRADLLDLSARFERMAAYYAAQITNLRRSPRSK